MVTVVMVTDEHDESVSSAADERHLLPLLAHGSPLQARGRHAALHQVSDVIRSHRDVRNTINNDFRTDVVHYAATAHCCRCIRPNGENSPGLFARDKVMTQLRYTGVLETTRIRQLGHPHRVTFADFIARWVS